MTNTLIQHPLNHHRSERYKERIRRYRTERRNLLNRLANLGITIEEFDQMVANQNGTCVICREKTAMHIHQNRGVRGVLCSNCTGGLGQFKDRIDVLERAIEYLKGTYSDGNNTI